MKESLKQENPSLYEHFEMIWKIRSDHLVQGYPQQYVYYLLACFKPGCSHGLCQRLVGSSRSDFHWFPNGLSLTQLPLPVADPGRPWGCTSCPDCRGHCAGYYLNLLESLNSSNQPCEPPSTVILRAFKAKSVDVEELARQNLLQTDEVKLWLEHLETVAEIANVEQRKKQRPVDRKQQRTESKHTNCMLVEFAVAHTKRRQRRQRNGQDVIDVICGFTVHVLVLVIYRVRGMYPV